VASQVKIDGVLRALSHIAVNGAVGVIIAALDQNSDAEKIRLAAEKAKSHLTHLRCPLDGKFEFVNAVQDCVERRSRPLLPTHRDGIDHVVFGSCPTLKRDGPAQLSWVWVRSAGGCKLHMQLDHSLPTGRSLDLGHDPLTGEYQVVGCPAISGAYVTDGDAHRVRH
jgi:hypothetical protein